MNTTISITVIAEDQDSTISVQNAIDQAFGEFDRIVKAYTRFAPDSELSVLNANNGKWMPVSEEFMMLIKYMLDLAERTNGTYDPTVIDLLEAYGYSAKYDFTQKLNDPELERKIQKIVETRSSFRKIELNETKLEVKLAPNQRLDLGGIGKGYAIDCAYDKLKSFQNFLIDAGGDVRSHGNNLEGQPWQIGLKHRREDQEGFIGKLAVSNASVSCSGSWARRVGKFHHIINMQTGRPAEEMQTVYTFAPTALLSDSWSTPLFLMGEAGFQVKPVEVEALLIDKGEHVYKTDKFPQILSV